MKYAPGFAFAFAFAFTLAFAESGGIVTLSGPDTPSSLNFVPDNHIVVVHTAQVVSHFEDVWAQWRASGRHRVIAGQNRVIDVVQVDLVLTGCEFRQRGTGRQALRLAGRVHVGEKIVQFPQVLEHRVLHAVLTTAGIADS